LIVNSGFEISSKLYNREKDGEAKLSRIRAGIDVQIISIKFEWVKFATLLLVTSVKFFKIINNNQATNRTILIITNNK